MTKNDVIEVISIKTGYTKEVVTTVLEEVNNVITRSLRKGEEVKLAGFGTFYPLDRQARKARNPRTGEEIVVPQKKVTKFKPGPELKVLT